MKRTLKVSNCKIRNLKILCRQGRWRQVILLLSGEQIGVLSACMHLWFRRLYALVCHVLVHAVVPTVLLLMPLPVTTLGVDDKLNDCPTNDPAILHLRFPGTSTQVYNGICMKYTSPHCVGSWKLEATWISISKGMIKKILKNENHEILLISSNWKK